MNFQVTFEYNEKKQRILSHCYRRETTDAPTDIYGNELGDGFHYAGCESLPQAMEQKLFDILQQWADGQPVDADNPVRDARNFLNKRAGYRLG